MPAFEIQNNAGTFPRLFFGVSVPLCSQSSLLNIIHLDKKYTTMKYGLINKQGIQA